MNAQFQTLLGGLRTRIFSTLALMILLVGCDSPTAGITTITELDVAYPNADQVPPAQWGSTHEIIQGENALWLTSPNHDAVVKVDLDGQMSFYPLPTDSAPHGIAFDAAGQLWVSLEAQGTIVQLDEKGTIITAYDVHLACANCAEAINPHPHGLGIGSDGRTIWYTGKGTGTVGKITPDGEITSYTLPTVGSVPIYVKAGHDGNMWVTELVGNKIARVTVDGEVTEFAIPTHNSRPIAIVPEPGGQAMWFTEEASSKVGRIAMDGTITEWSVPKTQDNVILAGLAFDDAKNLWVQQYVDPNQPTPTGADHIIKIDRAILTASPSDLSGIPISFYQVPTAETGMHRIILGLNGTLWFTELRTNKVGKITTNLLSLDTTP
ncbi:MAG TPA: hypothetical protein P5121_29350 [Caldilineaceae bacterium]|nr:hypothetical protein [Caldilineaceae bacterium]